MDVHIVEQPLTVLLLVRLHLLQIPFGQTVSPVRVLIHGVVVDI